MKVRLTWRNEVGFPDLTSGSQDAIEGRGLETLFKEMFRRVCYDACTIADREDEIPTKIVLNVEIEVFADDGKPQEDRTPRGLFELMPEADRAALKARKAKGVNHGG
jgi:hypothetical protein